MQFVGQNVISTSMSIMLLIWQFGRCHLLIYGVCNAFGPCTVVGQNEIFNAMRSACLTLQFGRCTVLIYNVAMHDGHAHLSAARRNTLFRHRFDV